MIGVASNKKFGSFCMVVIGSPTRKRVFPEENESTSDSGDEVEYN